MGKGRVGAFLVHGARSCRGVRELGAFTLPPFPGVFFGDPVREQEVFGIREVPEILVGQLGQDPVIIEPLCAPPTPRRVPVRARPAP